jgi:beta-glucosidase
VFVGYRHYDTARVEPLYPFGHGLSYAAFSWDDLVLGSSTLRDGDALEVSVRVRNGGTRSGSDVIQLYVHDRESRVRRPEQELRAFAKVTLSPGEETRVRLSLDRRAFAFWDAEVHAWATETGDFEIRLARSSRDVVLRAPLRLEVPRPLRAPFDRHTPIRRLLADEAGRAALLPVVGDVVKALFGSAPPPVAAGETEDGGSFFLDLPGGKLVGLSRGAVSREAIAKVLRAANGDRPLS